MHLPLDGIRSLGPRQSLIQLRVQLTIPALTVLDVLSRCHGGDVFLQSWSRYWLYDGLICRGEKGEGRKERKKLTISFHSNDKLNKSINFITTFVWTRRDRVIF